MKKLFQNDDKDVKVEIIDVDNVIHLLTVLYRVQACKIVNEETVQRWRKSLAMCRRTYKDFQTVFDWFLRKYPRSQYLQNTFKSATAIRDHFRELRLEHAKMIKYDLEIPKDSEIDPDILEAVTTTVYERLRNEWNKPREYVRYVAWEYMLVCRDVEVILFDMREKYKDTHQVWYDIVIPMMIETVQENFDEYLIDHIRGLIAWKEWSGELVGSKKAITPTNYHKIVWLLKRDAPRLSGMGYGNTHMFIVHSVMEQLGEIANESNQGK